MHNSLFFMWQPYSMSSIPENSRNHIIPRLKHTIYRIYHITIQSKTHIYNKLKHDVCMPYIKIN